MPAADRSFAEVVQDIVRNIQEIVRSEVRLAKAELSDEARKAKPAGLAIGAGAAFGLFTIGFGLLAAVYGLSTVMPNWAAALVVCAACGLVTVFALRSGFQRLARIDPTPDKTIRSLKENVAWSKQQLR